MSSTVGYFASAFRAKAMPFHGSDDWKEQDKFYDLGEELREITDNKFDLDAGIDFFMLSMRLGDDWDSGYYGLWSFEKLKAEVDEFWPKFVQWMCDKGHNFQPYGERKYFLEIYYNGVDSEASTSNWEDI